MGFRDREKQRQHTLGSEFFEGDPFQGDYSNIPRLFCLNDRRKNIFHLCREPAIQYFRNRKITWHDGGTEIRKNDLPSNHLCCSQSCCVNFNFPFISDAEGLQKLLIRLGYSVKKVLPIVLDKDKNEMFKNYVGFEWIGEENYLKEKIKKNTHRTRGEYFTSADFIFRFRQADNRIRIVLGEWKYTECYNSNKCIRYSKSGTDRLAIYQQFLESQTCQIRMSPSEFKLLFYDPFDQLMRLQLLATAMEKKHEMQADIVSTIHVVPKVNTEFSHRITSPKLSKYGNTVHSIWGKLVGSDRFKGVYLEDILNHYSESYQCDDVSEYMNRRYGNMK